MYKVEDFLEKCVLSCLNQDVSHLSYEIICVNDGSPDNSLQIAEKLATQYSNIKVITRNNGGLSAARNTGIEHAQGEYLFFVDSDDWIEMNCLGSICSQLACDKPDVLAICAANVYGSNTVRRFSYSNIKQSTGPESLKHVACACAPFLIVRKRMLDENNIRFYEGIYHEDNEYSPRMLYFAKKVIYRDDIVYFVYQNPNSITRTFNSKKVKDAVGVVAPNLYRFAEDYVNERYKSIFYNKIGSVINSTIHNNLGLSHSDIKEVNSLFYANRYLVNAFLKSTLIRYKIEGIFLILFPRHLVNIYYLLNRRTKQKVKSQMSKQSF